MSEYERFSEAKKSFAKDMSFRSEETSGSVNVFEVREVPEAGKGLNGEKILEGGAEKREISSGDVEAREAEEKLPEELLMWRVPASGKSLLATLFRRHADKVVYMTGESVQLEKKAISDFFIPEKSGESEMTVGSGFIIHPAGYILTNAHSVMRSVTPIVELRNGSQYEAEIISLIRNQDVALVKIKPKEPLPAVRFAGPEEVAVGDALIIIGAPHALKYTLTYGIICAKGRTSHLQDISGVTLRDLLQTDAAINPGTSGGPWLDLRGNVIGMTVSKRSDADNVGFGISVKTLHRLLPMMLHSAVKYRFHSGFTLELQQEEMDKSGMKKVVPSVTVMISGEPQKNEMEHSSVENLVKNGSVNVISSENAVTDESRTCCCVASVEEDSAAAKAGLRKGDIIQKVDGHVVHTPLDFYLNILEKEPGDQIQLLIRRKAENSSDVSQAQEQEKTFTLEFLLAKAAELAVEDIIHQRLQMNVAPLPEEQKKDFNLRTSTGVVVTGLNAAIYGKLESPPHVGDILASVNYQRPKDPEHLARILESISPQTPLNLVFLNVEVENGKKTYSRIDVRNLKVLSDPEKK
ncbi:MAG: trypsin-like peptidase domain-containing protein [Planctomycetia bacterium]|nr:trypsin-like peptidase domain-containing protein [Planctomycetia bacterium]